VIWDIFSEWIINITQEVDRQMTIFNWLALFSIPTLIASLWAHLIRRIKHSDEQTRALQKGVQALLRERLIHSYRKFFKLGFVDYNDRLNVENMYQQYHSLGENGVMDDMHLRFMNLPIGSEHEVEEET
jgi:hypothetical protein